MTLKVVLESYFSSTLAREWMDLLRFNRYTVQQTPVWMKSYIAHFLCDKDVLFVTVRGDDGKLVSCLPLQQQKRRFYMLFTYRRWQDLGSGVNDFFNIVCRDGYEEAVAAVLAEWFRNQSQKWERLQLSFMPEGNALQRHFIENLGKLFPVQVSTNRFFYLIDTSRKWDEFFTPEMNKRLRDIRGRMNRARKAGFEVQCRIVKENIGDHFADFLSHFKERRLEKNERNSYEDPAKVALIRDVIDQGQANNDIQLALLEDQYGQVWAYQLDLLDRKKGIWYHYAPTFNDKFREFSPSKILLFETLKLAFADADIDEFNFMRGEAEYKKQFTETSRTYTGIDVVNIFSRRVRFQTLIAEILKHGRSN